MHSGHRDTRVDDFIQKLPEWQQAICVHIRRLVHEAEPEVQETIKRGDRPYFVLAGNICAFQAAKDHINVFIYDPIALDPEGLINQGHDNHTARAIQIYQGQSVPDAAFKRLITAVANNNRAGGWRKLR
ncbi:MAG TPA: DUF1801 domain-containing protein [Candidatus Saccharimonadales bacterium]|nr:DUF1801 domain-containing protein [Candidatus Saccharimonadales bacterium]